MSNLRMYFEVSVLNFEHGIIGLNFEGQYDKHPFKGQGLFKFYTYTDEHDDPTFDHECFSYHIKVEEDFPFPTLDDSFHPFGKDWEFTRVINDMTLDDAIYKRVYDEAERLFYVTGMRIAIAI